MPSTFSLEKFHPIVARWFSERLGKPTEIQEAAWERIAAGEHCLISAATGSGKTLAAFLWSVNQLLSGSWESGGLRVLYISPLKALNNDIHRNLLAPLAELRERFESEGIVWPEISVATRSGDTEQGERRRLIRKPPEILITTPESLNLLLTSKDGQRSLLGVKTLILDEIHSVVGSKRGVYLMSAVERLAHLNGEFQRVALSATVKPMQTVASFVGGYIDGKPRQVLRAESKTAKRYEIEVRHPEDEMPNAPKEDPWKEIVGELKELVKANRSTLIFVNSRLLCEKIAHKMNLGEPEPLAYSHHGSLSREIRFAVERRLKEGELKAIVATNSLEMGIDVGALDCVVMVQSPNQISSAIQRIGRAGHQVGAVSRAVVFPSHARDFMEAAVLSESIREKDIEAITPIEGPLDVLAQVIVSALGAGEWDIDELFSVVRRSYSYRSLSREQFDLVLSMLAGRYSGSRLRELKPRVSISVAANTVTLRKGALMAFYFSGGVIPDRGYFHLRHVSDGGRIGELDEEFVWERKIGDVFTLGVQSWKIEKITYNDVFVAPAPSGEMAPPFWKSERYNRDFHYSERIGEFLEWANRELESKGFSEQLATRYSLEKSAADRLKTFLEAQRKATRCDLPHRRHIVAEVINEAPSGAPGSQLVLHTHWGGRVNRPYALALDAAWDEAFGNRTEVYVNDDCVVVQLPDDVSVDEVMDLVTLQNLDTHLRRRLEGSGFFGARFREAAGNALLITRNKAGQRLPLWLSRLRSKKLIESVRRFDDFPIMLEAWRTCLRDEFDMEALKQVLGEFERGEIRLSTTRTSVASPFAASVAWRQINDEYMYATDDPPGDASSGLREDLLSQVAFDDALRPRLSLELVEQFERKRQRREAGYEPSDWVEAKEWLRERIVLSAKEWSALVSGLEEAGGEVPVIKCRLGNEDFVYLGEEGNRVGQLFGDEPDADVFQEWLSFFGPVSIDSIREMFGWSATVCLALLDGLVDERRLVKGALIEDSEDPFVCDADNYESLLRMKRARGRRQVEPLPLEDLALFLANWQGLVSRGEGVDATEDAVAQLLGVTAGIGEWERSILPSRVDGYYSGLLDTLVTERGFAWRGVGEGKVTFAYEEDVEGLYPRDGTEGESEVESQVLAAMEGAGRFSFGGLVETLGISSNELEAVLWRLVWKGRASNDTFAAARRGAMGNFALCGKAVGEARSRRPGRFGRSVRAVRVALYPGSWYRLESLDEGDDPIERLEVERERARVLLERYGVVFRELLQREEEGYRWRDVFKALRLMELSGEVIGGRFFEGVPGLQFASKAGVRALQAKLPRERIYWMAATDPVSLCGIGLDGLKGELPARRSGIALVYRGTTLVAEVHRSGKALVFHIDEADSDMVAILARIEEILGVGRPGFTKINLEEINGEDARKSVYLESLDNAFRLHCDHKQVVIEGRR